MQYRHQKKHSKAKQQSQPTKHLYGSDYDHATPRSSEKQEKAHMHICCKKPPFHQAVVKRPI